MTHLSDSFHKARKIHRCGWCDERIQVNEKYYRRSYVWEGEFHCDQMHLECEVAMGKSHRDSLEEGWTPGDFKRGEVA